VGPRGIPHSWFLGGPHRWTEDDRNKALAWQELQRQTCVCGTRGEEWNPAKGGSRDAYEAEIVTCPGCAAIERAQEDESTRTLKGRQVRLRKT
jgi:hypothetical protein